MSTQLATFDKLKAQVTLFVDPTKDISVTDSGTNIVAQGVLKTIVAFKKQIEENRVALKKPHLDATRQIDIYAREISEPLEKAESLLKSKMAAWARIESQQRADAQRKLEDERLAQQRAAQAVRDAQEAEARKKFSEEQKALKLKLEAERKAAELEAKENADAAKAFGIDPEKQKAEAQAAKQALADKAESDRKELAFKAETERAESRARFEREEAQRISDLKAKEKEIELSRPKNIRMIPEWSIVSQDDVPEEFWVIDEVKLGAFIRNNAGKPGFKSIPGVKVTMVESVVAR